MSNTIYWAVKLDMESVARLVSHFPPVHSNIYAEHVTVAFQPTREQEEYLIPYCGKQVALKVVGYGEDDKGQAVVVSGIDRFDKGIPHVTISCSDDTKPVYSNTLLSKGFSSAVEIPLTGVMARYSRGGWDTSCKELQNAENNGLGSK